MTFDIHTKEIEIEGMKTTVDVGVYTLQNGNVYTEAVNPDDLTGEEVLDYHDEEMRYFIENEQEMIDNKIEAIKKRVIEALTKKMELSINKNEVIEHMYENAYDDYVGWGGDYEKGIVGSFDKYLQYIVERIAGDYSLFELQED